METVETTNQTEQLRAIATKLYIESADQCFFAAFIAAAALEKLKHFNTSPTRETCYISPPMLARQLYKCYAKKCNIR